MIMLKAVRYLSPLLLSLPVLAAPDIDILMGAEDDFLGEMPIVLSATRLTQPLNESPVAMTVIDREMIEASGARSIPDLLRLVPGFQVGYFDGNTPVATYHGHSDENSKRIQVLIDGRSVYLPSLAGIQWQDLIIGIDDIDHIEVSRGTNASSYGNNSFFAVVSIFTRQAIEDHGHKIKAVVGSHDTEDAYYRFGGQQDDLNYRVTIGTKNDDGTDLLNDYTEADYLSYRLDYQIDSKSNLSYQGGLKDALYGDHEPLPDHDIEVTSAFQWLKWEHLPSNKHNLSLQYYYNYHNQEEFIKTVTAPAITLPLPAPPPTSVDIDGFSLDSTLNIKSERHDLEFNHQYTVDQFRIVSGLSARLDIVNANEVFDEDGSQRNMLYRAFSHGEYRHNQNWLFNAGLMIETNEISGTDLSPRIAVIRNLNKHHTLRFSASQATRSPVLWEEHANYRLSTLLTQDGGNPLIQEAQDTYFGGTDILTNQFVISSGDLESEEITSFELGYIAQLLNNKLILDIKLFKDQTDDLITLVDDVAAPDDNFDTSVYSGDPSAVADDFQNTHETDLEGIEVSIDYHHSKDLRIYTYYAYINIDAEAFNPLANTANERRFEVSAPTNSYGLMFIKHWPEHLSTSLNYFRIGDMDWMDRTGSTSSFYNDKSAQPYSKLDLKISKAYFYGQKKLNIALTLQNLLEDFYDYNKTRYTDATLTTVAPPSGISSYGSLQDQRVYLEASLMFD